MKLIYLVIFVGISLFIISCNKNEEILSPEQVKYSRAVYIVNEGNFMKSNSSLSMYLPDSGKVYNDIYQTMNSKKLGDVAQNMYEYNGKGFIVINNSNKIVIIDLATNKLIDTLTSHLNSPRAISFMSDKMYVSNLYGSSISVFSGNNYKTFLKEIKTMSNPDEMLVFGPKIYCCHSSGYQSPSTRLSVIDGITDQVEKVIKVGYNPTMLKVSSSIVVLCSGEYNDFNNPNDDIFAKLFFIEISTNTVRDSLFVGGHSWDFAIDGEKNDNAYVIGDEAIVKVDLTQKKILNSKLIPGYFYSIAYDNTNKEIYVGDAKDYKSNGEVSVYNSEGVLKNKFSVGLIPGAFCFYNKQLYIQ